MWTKPWHKLTYTHILMYIPPVYIALTYISFYSCTGTMNKFLMNASVNISNDHYYKVYTREDNEREKKLFFVHLYIN